MSKRSTAVDAEERAKLGNVSFARRAVSRAKQGSIHDIRLISDNITLIPLQLVPDAVTAMLRHLATHPPVLNLENRKQAENTGVAEAIVSGLASLDPLLPLVPNIVSPAATLHWPQILDSFWIFYYSSLGPIIPDPSNSHLDSHPLRMISRAFANLTHNGIEPFLSLPTMRLAAFLWHSADRKSVIATSHVLLRCIQSGRSREFGLQDHLLETEGGAKQVATLALHRLRRYLRKDPLDANAVILLANVASGLVTDASPHSPFRVPLQEGHLASHYSKAISLVWKHCDEPLLRETVEHYLIVLPLLTHSWTTLNSLVESIRSGLLRIILDILPLVTTSEDTIVQNVQILLSHIIPQHLVIHSFLRVVIDALRSLPCDLEKYLTGRSALKPVWDNFQDLVLAHAVLKYRYDREERKRKSTCSNCNKLDTAPLKKCAACECRFYCSRECQAAHWRERGHRKECKVLQEENVECFKDIRRKDLEFIRLVASMDIRRHLRSLLSMAPAACPDIPIDYLAFSIDYRTSPSAPEIKLINVLTLNEILQSEPCPSSHKIAQVRSVVSCIRRGNTVMRGHAEGMLIAVNYSFVITREEEYKQEFFFTPRLAGGIPLHPPRLKPGAQVGMMRPLANVVGDIPAEACYDEVDEIMRRVKEAGLVTERAWDWDAIEGLLSSLDESSEDWPFEYH